MVRDSAVSSSEPFFPALEANSGVSTQALLTSCLSQGLLFGWEGCHHSWGNSGIGPGRSQRPQPGHTTHEGWHIPGDTDVADIIVQPILEAFLSVGSYRSLTLADGFDSHSGFVVGKGVFKPFPKCCHEAVKVAQLCITIHSATVPSSAIVTYDTLAPLVGRCVPYSCM